MRESGNRWWRRWAVAARRLAAIVGLVGSGVVANAPALAYVIVPFEQEAEVFAPADGAIIDVPRSAPFATVTATGRSLLTYFATTDAIPIEVSHLGFLALDADEVHYGSVEIVPAFAFTDFFGRSVLYGLTRTLPEGRHVAQIAHKIVTPDSVIRGIAVDTNIFCIVAVDMPERGALAVLAGAAALVAASRRRRRAAPVQPS